MNIGNAPCSWGIYYANGNSYTADQYLDQVAASGYVGTELGPLGFLPRDPAQLNDALAQRALKLIGATHVHPLADPESATQLFKTLTEFSILLKSVGSDQIVIMDDSNWYPMGQQGTVDETGWKAMIKTVREAHCQATDLGMSLTFHPHVGTCVETEAQIDRLLDETPVNLCFDTGHHAYWGQDVLTFMQRHWNRIGYMHLKNVDPAIRARVLNGELTLAQAWAAGIMCPLPDGAVDIRAVTRFLRDKNYKGPCVVEQDPRDHAIDEPAALARRNREYLETFI